MKQEEADIDMQNAEELEKAIAFEREERKKTIKTTLPAEPEDGQPDVATIGFRAPGSGKRF